MKLNNLRAAEALLHLFNIEMSWEKVEELGPTYFEPLKSIVSMVKFIDGNRAGELITTDPDPDMLTAAYDAGYRLAFTQSKCKCCSTIDSMLHIVKPVSAENNAELVMPSQSHANTWKELKKVVPGFTEQAYTLKDMGEMIINDLSKRRAFDRNFCTEFKYKQHKDLHKGFIVKNEWKLPSLNLKQLKQLETLLQESIYETCGKQVNLKLSARGGGEWRGFINFYTPEFLFDKHTEHLVLDADITTASPQQLSAINFQAILDSFRQKASLLPADTLTLTHQIGNLATKEKYYTRFFRDARKELPGHITSAEMKAIIQADNDARRPKQP